MAVCKLHILTAVAVFITLHFCFVTVGVSLYTIALY